MSTESVNGGAKGASRRQFIRRAAYAAPVLLTLPAVPAMAQVGSGALCSDADPGLIPIFDADGNFLGCES
jgi:hypothetical protein